MVSFIQDDQVPVRCIKKFPLAQNDYVAWMLPPFKRIARCDRHRLLRYQRATADFATEPKTLSCDDSLSELYGCCGRCFGICIRCQ